MTLEQQTCSRLFKKKIQNGLALLGGLFKTRKAGSFLKVSHLLPYRGARGVFCSLVELL